MDFENLSTALAREIKPIYIINGGESYLTTASIKMIESKLNITLPEFNKIIIPDDYNGSAKDIVASAQALPMFDKYRLIIVNDYLVKKNEMEKKVFLKYFVSPNPTTCLVFFSTNKSDFFTSLEGKCEKINCEKVSSEFLNRFVTNRLEHFNLIANNLVINKLEDFCNYSITKVNTELSKLATIKATSLDRNLTKEDIENYITKDLEYIIFDLTQAITDRNNDKAYLLIDSMLKNKEQPTTILVTITGHFRRLFFISRSSLSTTELSEFLQVKPYAIGKYKAQTRLFSVKQLKDIFDKCVEIEFMIKSGKMNAENALSYLLSNILSI